MPFVIVPVLASDIPYLSIIQWAALRDNPLIETLYPQGPTPALVAFTTDSYRRALNFPSVRLIKALDGESGEIVGFAKWIVYPEEKDSLGKEEEGEKQNGGGWGHGKSEGEAPPRPEGMDERALGAWNDVIARTRKKVMKSMKHECRLKGGCSLECYFGSIAPALWVLDIIHTHPAHQSRGVGALLLRWGIDRADKSRMQCYVESSPAGLALLRKHDFEDITEMQIDLNRYKTHQYHYDQNYKHTVMIRPPETPPLMPPKDLNVIRQSKQGEWDFGLLDSHSSVGSGYGVTRKASLIEIKRSPRLDRSPRPDASSSSKESGSMPSLTEREMGTSSPGPVEQVIESYASRDAWWSLRDVEDPFGGALDRRKGGERHHPTDHSRPNA